MQAERIICVRGGPRKVWIPVPSLKLGTDTCVPLSSTKSPWANKLLQGNGQGRDSTTSALALSGFELSMRECLGVGAAISSPNVSKKRQLLDSDDEGEPEEDSQQSQDSLQPDGSQPAGRASGGGGSKLASQQKCVKKAGLCKHELDGVLVELGFRACPGLVLAASEPNLMGVVNFIDNHFEELVVRGRKAKLAKISAASGAGSEIIHRVKPSDVRWKRDVADSSDSNRIRFEFRRGAYAIHYQDEAGNFHRFSKSFEVARTNLLGQALKPKEYAAAKAHVLKKARVAWNERDKSDAQRFDP